MTEVKTMDIARIKQLIPHRYPMLMVDRIVDVILGKSATGIKNVTSNEPYFAGHFPAKPIMPGVLIIEAMAQTAAALVVESLGEKAFGKLVYFMSVEGAKFRKPVVPGDVLEMKIVLQKNRGAVWKFSGEALVNNCKVAEATYSAMIAEGEG